MQTLNKKKVYAVLTAKTSSPDHYGITLSSAPADAWRKQVISWAWRIKVSMHMETELMGAMKERGEIEAIEVFATNLKDLLMAAPAGPRATLGLIRVYVPVRKSLLWIQPVRFWQQRLFTLTHLKSNTTNRHTLLSRWFASSMLI